MNTPTNLIIPPSNRYRLYGLTAPHTPKDDNDKNDRGRKYRATYKVGTKATAKLPVATAIGLKCADLD